MEKEISRADNLSQPFSRDPAGFVFSQNDVTYRQINRIYERDYNELISSGLYDKLVGSNLLIPHVEADMSLAQTESAFKIIRPNAIPFISYPFEWCFGQLKSAALATLEIQKIALEYNMSLKDSSAYNIQFLNGKPLLIDTLSLERYQEGPPWIAYRQFCEHFLAPLALMRYRDVRLNRLHYIYGDGIPLDLASSLLPSRSWMNFSILAHVHLHSRAQKKYVNQSIHNQKRKMTKFALCALIDNLQQAISNFNLKLTSSEWSEYTLLPHSQEAAQYKKEIVARLQAMVQPKPCRIWDIGSNTGEYSRLVAENGIYTVSIDSDHDSVELNYRRCLKTNEKNILPLLMDVTNPTSGRGWECEETRSLEERGPVDLILALAILHHVVITRNIPMDRVASLLRKLCRDLIIEFVPKNDPQVQKLLMSRKDIFTDYTQESFERVFGRYFQILAREAIGETGRILYFMKNNESN
ncbi:MAG: class I SAM-dependent methyltransferase [Planctomycetes bacterium]|nr:class I SAM-dependent methyltransferase [Planctomycetota bacterium]